MTFRLSENCSICSSPRWCGRPCVHAPKAPFVSEGEWVDELAPITDEALRSVGRTEQPKAKIRGKSVQLGPRVVEGLKQAVEHAQGKRELKTTVVRVKKLERERQIEHMVDPPVILTKEMAAEGEAARDGAMEALAAGKPYVPTKRGRPAKRTPEERKAYRAELMRKKRAEGKA